MSCPWGTNLSMCRCYHVFVCVCVCSCTTIFIRMNNIIIPEKNIRKRKHKRQRNKNKRRRMKGEYIYIYIMYMNAISLTLPSSTRFLVKKRMKFLKCVEKDWFFFIFLKKMHSYSQKKVCHQQKEMSSWWCISYNSFFSKIIFRTT